MYVQLSLTKVLAALRESLHSIDIRSAVKEDESGWLDLLTAIRVSARSVNDVKLRHAKLIKESPSIQADPFRVLFAALPFDHIDLLLDELSKGHCTLGENQVLLPQPIAIDQAQSTVQRWHDIVRPWESEQWAGAFYPFGTRSASFQEPELVEAVLKKGWRSPESATASLLELDKQRIFSQTISLFIYVEMPARIKVMNTDAQSFAVHVKAENKLSGLALYCTIDSETDEHKKLDLHINGHESGFQLLTSDTIPTPDPSKILSCWLSNSNLAVIDTISERFGQVPPMARPKQLPVHSSHDPMEKSPRSHITDKRIFISHINEETSLATGLKQSIEKSFSGQCPVFVSSHPKDLPAGTRWLEEINKALETASLLIVLCSPHSLGRPWINFEAGFCWSRKIPIVPVCHSGQQLNTLPPPLSSFQSLEVEDGKFSELLVHAIGKHLAIEPASELDFRRMDKELAQTIPATHGEPIRQTSLRPKLRDGNLELARVLEQQDQRERMKRAQQMVTQMLPSPLKIEFDGEHSVEWIERPHPALPAQQVCNKVYGVVIYNSAGHDIDSVTVELERVEDLTNQHSADKKPSPYIGHKLIFQRNGKNTMKFSPELRDRVRLISHGTGIMMRHSFQIEGNDNYFIDAGHQHRIFLKVTGDGVKPAKASFIVQLDETGILHMIKECDSPAG